MESEHHPSLAELADGLPDIHRSPPDQGTLVMIVVRPEVERRELPESGEITPAAGLVNDRWARSCTHRLPDGRLNPETQLTLLNARAAALFAGSRDRWPLAGDNLVVDFDLGVANLPVGQRLKLGHAVIEITAAPHTGCSKFSGRFGRDALEFVNSPDGRQLRLRGAHARVVQAGRIKLGDRIDKL